MQNMPYYERQLRRTFARRYLPPSANWHHHHYCASRGTENLLTFRQLLILVLEVQPPEGCSTWKAEGTNANQGFFFFALFETGFRLLLLCTLEDPSCINFKIFSFWYTNIVPVYHYDLLTDFYSHTHSVTTCVTDMLIVHEDNKNDKPMVQCYHITLHYDTSLTPEQWRLVH
ncbi:hypothetical protein AVEN_164954-1 [Araneus ventricosus]|uniref:Uncharacterized protein n=1 Tax=Araneus ventricosus TaxID=182803 RepID=A0A4Y2PL34_ARAVE|nr:hypothetical protein AVEN_164954-1 [Araneus ventricosus]